MNAPLNRYLYQAHVSLARRSAPKRSPRLQNRRVPLISTVLVNAVAARAGGGLHHLFPFVRNLAIRLPAAHLHVYAPSSTSAVGSTVETTNVSWHSMDLAQGLTPQRLIWDHWQFPRRASDSLLLSPLNFATISSKHPQLLMIRNSLYFDDSYLHTLDSRARLLFEAQATYSLMVSRFAEAIVVPSQAMKVFLLDSGFREAPLHVIPHPLPPLPTGHTLDAALRSAWASGDAKLLYVGSAERHKNIISLANILHGLQARGIDCRLVVTLSESDSSLSVAALRGRLELLGLAESVIWTGSVDRPTVAALYRTADVLISPSLTESYGFAVAEAISVGTPVVSSDIPAARELGSLGDAAFYPPRSPNEAVQAIDVLLRSSRRISPELHGDTYPSWERYSAQVAELMQALV